MNKVKAVAAWMRYRAAFVLFDVARGVMKLGGRIEGLGRDVQAIGERLRPPLARGGVYRGEIGQIYVGEKPIEHMIGRIVADDIRRGGPVFSAVAPIRFRFAGRGDPARVVDHLRRGGVI